MYYVFHIAYQTLTKTLTFFDSMMLKLKREVGQKAVHKCIIQAVAKLNGLKQKQKPSSNNRKCKGNKKSTK